MTRYHPLLVALHWIMASMIPVSLAAGWVLLHSMPEDSPEKIEALGAHMGFGIAIGVLLILRFATRHLTAKPPRATTGSPALDRIGVWTHRGFYVLIACMVLTGLATAFGAGLFPIVFGGSGEPLPAHLHDLPQLVAHGMIASLLATLIALHVAAAFFHQFIRKDQLLRRMWFGKRN